MSTTTTKYAKERRIATLAVERAALLTEIIQGSHVKGTVTKEDNSPVTMADLGAQALIIATIAHAFPEDSIVGEEDAQYLRESKTRKDLLWKHIAGVLERTRTGYLSPEELGTVKDADHMMDLIDKGNSEGGRVGRIWALDPVDGTKGFLRGDQYAVCLGLILDGKVVVGAINCPSLRVDPKDPDSALGLVFSAESGQGSTMKQTWDHNEISGAAEKEMKSISMNAISSLSEASFCEGVEAGHSSHDLQARIASRLGITKPSVRMDSQAKYVSVARGDGDVYLRLPTSATYREKIWDHAAGSLIVEEAGGKVSDMHGKPLDFGLGRTLKENQGVIVAYKSLHAKVIEAVQVETTKSAL